MAKEKNNVLMSFWINKNLKTEFMNTATALNTNMSTEINRLVREYVEANRKKVEEASDMWGDAIVTPTVRDEEAGFWS